MPTPFTHLVIAQRLLRDDDVPPGMRDSLNAERGAFLLGNIAADSRVSSGAARDATHFYHFRTGITQHPWRVMVNRYPGLLTPVDAAQRAFVAGYVAHLSVDEIWSLRMVGPHFARGEWGGDIMHRFYILQMLHIYMDERDFPYLEPWQAAQLSSTEPCHWLPFIPDDDLRHWQGLVCEQIKPGGKSKTLQVLGERIDMTPRELRAFVDSPDQMQSRLWNNVPPALLAEVEEQMYKHAREQLVVYMEEAVGKDVDC